MEVVGKVSVREERLKFSAFLAMWHHNLASFAPIFSETVACLRIVWPVNHICAEEENHSFHGYTFIHAPWFVFPWNSAYK